MISGGMKLDLWRASTDNDRPAIRKGNYHGIWEQAVKQQQIDEITVHRINPAQVQIKSKMTLPTVQASYLKTFTIYGNGEVNVSMQLDKSKVKKEHRHPHRFGMEILLDGHFDHMTWYGRGPNATYIDKKYESIGRFQGSVDEQWVDYARPQANGNKEDVRWLLMRDRRGDGLLFRTNTDPFGVGAKFYSKASMEKAKYSYELERSEHIYLNIDHKQLGVGGDNSWGRTAHEPYQLTEPEYQYSFSFRGVSAEEDWELSLQKQILPTDSKSQR
jgi:beta-galactosidase